MAVTTHALETIDLTPQIGTQVTITKEALLRGEYANELRRLLQDRGVLVVRGAHLSKDEQIQVSKTLGTLKIQTADKSGLESISLDPKVSMSADYLKGSVFWHIDGATDDVPNFAATLNPAKLSEEGGRTYFCNTYAAYDALPDDEKAEIDSLRVKHSLEAAQRMVTPEPPYEMVKLWQTHRPGKSHPLVWTHVNGRKSLVLGATADYVEGMSVEEGRALLAKLRDWSTQDQFVYGHDWEMGDLLIWDNTGTMHRVDPYPLDSGRLLIRTTINGEEAVA